MGKWKIWVFVLKMEQNNIMYISHRDGKEIRQSYQRLH